MKNLDVRHFLHIYTKRKEMQENNITKPNEEIKLFTKEFVEKLQNMSLDDEVILQDNYFFDSLGNLIIRIPI